MAEISSDQLLSVPWSCDQLSVISSVHVPLAAWPSRLASKPVGRKVPENGALAAEMVARGTTYEPEAGHSAFYSERFETYREVYAAVRGLHLSDTLRAASSDN